MFFFFAVFIPIHVGWWMYLQPYMKLLFLNVLLSIAIYFSANEGVDELMKLPYWIWMCFSLKNGYHSLLDYKKNIRSCLVILCFKISSLAAATVNWPVVWQLSFTKTSLCFCNTHINIICMFDFVFLVIKHFLSNYDFSIILHWFSNCKIFSTNQ